MKNENNKQYCTSNNKSSADQMILRAMTGS